MKKSIVTGVLSLLLCASLITGGTFALFTGKTTANITANAAKIEVVAAVNAESVESKQLNTEYTSGAANTFAGGVTVGTNSIALDKIVPGDGVKFTIDVANHSNVDVKYRALLVIVTDDGLFEGLTVKVNGAATAWDGTSSVGNWTDLGVGADPASVSLEITMEVNDKNDLYQNTSCEIAYMVEAVPGNVAVENPVEGVTYIYTANDLRKFAASVNEGKKSYAGETVKLMADIDLGGEAWTPIGQTGATEFKGTFDGQGHTIKNLMINSNDQKGDNYSSGLFGWLEDHGEGVTVKNVNVAGATVSGHKNVAVIAGYAIATIENCHVSDAVLVNTHATAAACGDKTGVIVGCVGGSAAVIATCSATDCTVTGARDAGQLVGSFTTGSIAADCTATNVTVTANAENCTDDKAGMNIGGLVGRKQ